MHPDIRQYFCFNVNGFYYECIALPFGWSLAPAIFTKLMRPVLAIIRAPTLVTLPPCFLLATHVAVTASIYLDDLLVLITKAQDGDVVVQAVVDMYAQLGLKVKESKSVLTPQRYVEHLGFLLDCTRHLVMLPPAKLAKVHALCKTFVHHVTGNKRTIRKRKLAKIVGFLQSCTYALPFGRFYLTHLYAAFSTSPGWEGTVRVSHPAIKAVQQYWLHLADQTTQRAWFTPCRSVIVTTDACARGWGAFYRTLHGVFFI